MNYTKLRQKLNPDPGGQDTLVLRVGTVTAIGSDGAVTVTMVDGAVIEDVPVLGGATFALNSVVQILTYRGSMLVIGAAGDVASLPAVASAANLTDGTTVSTSFTNTLSTGIHGVVFVAPPSGVVFVIGRSTGSNSNAGSYSLLDFQVNVGDVIGSGTIVRGSQELKASVLQSSTATEEGEHCTTDLVTGLTPGAVYNACLTYHTGSGGTASYNRRHITVLPQ